MVSTPSFPELSRVRGHAITPIDPARFSWLPLQYQGQTERGGFGAGGRTRTLDNPLTRRLPYRLGDTSLLPVFPGCQRSSMPVICAISHRGPSPVSLPYESYFFRSSRIARGASARFMRRAEAYLRRGFLKAHLLCVLSDSPDCTLSFATGALPALADLYDGACVPTAGLEPATYWASPCLSSLLSYVGVCPSFRAAR